MNKARIQITGIVQGVGFRPFVYNLAATHGLNGYCLNDSEGVVIEAEGASLDEFIRDLRLKAPPLSKIETITVTDSSERGFSGFTIRESVAVTGKSVLVSPDISICGDCLRELFDPTDRRHLYPFINCTNCGPRYSIVKDIPYDRPRTTMARFTLCPKCDKEYHDPSNRRFHAQPNACERCGPKAWLAYRDGSKTDAGVNFNAIKEAQRLLKEGNILAIKGLGGFHLACDATNDEAVKRLREKKRKSFIKGGSSNKPFAVMSPDMESIRSFALVEEKEEAALKHRMRPIVLLRKSASTLSPHVAPGNNRYGVMLPYTPLHFLLFHEGGFKALVMTSGNLSDEPIVISNEEAIARLSMIADYMLLHDRDIYMRVDDSIVRVDNGVQRVLRRARGFTPDAIPLGEEMDEIFAAGPLLKNTFTITKGHNAIVGQHMGDLENVDALEFYKETLRNLKNTFKAEPKAVALDMHPDYMSSAFAKEYAESHGIKIDRIIPVQHHHAHIASVMAEHGLTDEVIGIAFDGTGLGVDGEVWGGEFFVTSRRTFTRSAHLSYVRLPGGDAAVREPWRMALSCLVSSFGENAEKEAPFFFERREAKEAAIVKRMVETGLNSPLTSSAGRLFDAVASIIGLKDRISFEAEAAIELESIAEIREGLDPYPFGIKEGKPAIIDTAPLIRAIVEDVRRGVSKGEISGKFHLTMAETIVTVAKAIREETGLAKAALSGGVFQNATLLSLALERLEEAGFKCYTNERVPANDGGVSLGQAVVAWEKLKKGG